MLYTSIDSYCWYTSILLNVDTIAPQRRPSAHIHNSCVNIVVSLTRLNNLSYYYRCFQETPTTQPSLPIRYQRVSMRSAWDSILSLATISQASDMSIWVVRLCNRVAKTRMHDLWTNSFPNEVFTICEQKSLYKGYLKKIIPWLMVSCAKASVVWHLSLPLMNIFIKRGSHFPHADPACGGPSYSQIIVWLCLNYGHDLRRYGKVWYFNIQKQCMSHLKPIQLITVLELF